VKYVHDFNHNLKYRYFFGDRAVDRRIILKRIFKNCGGRVCTGFVWLWIEISAGRSSKESGNARFVCVSGLIISLWLVCKQSC
jgi:hypothetical protein